MQTPVQQDLQQTWLLDGILDQAKGILVLEDQDTGRTAGLVEVKGDAVALPAALQVMPVASTSDMIRTLELAEVRGR